MDISSWPRLKMLQHNKPNTLWTSFSVEMHSQWIYKVPVVSLLFCEVGCGKAHSHGFPNRVWEFQWHIVLVQHRFHSTITMNTQRSDIALPTCFLIRLKHQTHLASIWSRWTFTSPRPYSVTIKTARFNLTAGSMKPRLWNGVSEWTRS